MTDDLRSRIDATLAAPRARSARPIGIGPTGTVGVVYEACIVSFIDVLGFRSILMNRSAAEVHAVLAVLRDGTRPDDEPPPRGMDEVRLTSRAFAEAVSDAVVRVRVYDTQQRDGALFWELLDLLHSQLDCIGRGVLIRAGVAIGDAHVGLLGQGPVFGPAMVRAYEIERDEARFPRIVIDEPLYAAVREDERLRSEGHDIDDEVGYVDGILKVDTDGRRFIDYLRAGEQEFDDMGDYLAFVAAHARLIRQGLADCVAEPHLQPKYDWLRQYHNDVLDEILQEFRSGLRSATAFEGEYEEDPLPIIERLRICNA